MKRTIVAIVLLFDLGAAALLAHGGGPHLKGTVSSIGADQITVAGTDGRSAVVKITPQTEFVAGKAAGKREDLKEGDRVVVHTRKRDGGLEAIEIRYKPRK
jgi:hypothetical protein